MKKLLFVSQCLVFLLYLCACTGIRELPAAELQEIENYLNDDVNNGFICYNTYTRPEEISLRDVFYDGAGVRRNTPLSDEERAYSGDKEYLLSFLSYVTHEDAEKVVREKLGIPMSEVYTSFEKTDGYIASFDKLYYSHSDCQYCFIEVLSGHTDELGRYVIEYQDNSHEEPDFKAVVTLNKVGDIYQFVSNAIIH